MTLIVVGAGSNIDPRVNIQKAKSLLADRFELVKTSRFHKKKAIGPIEQPDFVNGAFLIRTNQIYDDVQAELKKIEEILGRPKNHEKWGPRTIDLDILVWDNKIIDQDVHTRDFLRQAIVELLPDFQF